MLELYRFRLRNQICGWSLCLHWGERAMSMRGMSKLKEVPTWLQPSCRRPFWSEVAILGRRPQPPQLATLLGLEQLLTGSKDWRQVLVVLREDLGLGEPPQPRACLVRFRVLGFLKFEECDCFSINNSKTLLLCVNSPKSQTSMEARR